MTVVPHDRRALKKILPKPGSLQRPRRRLGRPHAGLIEDQGARVAGEDAGDRDALSLAPRRRRAALAQKSVRER
jgi:hypothetical protein